MQVHRRERGKGLKELQVKRERERDRRSCSHLAKSGHYFTFMAREHGDSLECDVWGQR